MSDPVAAYALEWGVKASFRRYVRSAPDGFCEVSDGVRLPGGGRYAFPLAAVVGTPTAALRFEGGVLFTAHGGLMRVPIVDPWLTGSAGGWVFSVAGGASPGARVDIGSAVVAAVDRDAGAVRFDLRITDDGVAHFGGNYPVGIELDPLLVTPPASVIGDLAPTHHIDPHPTKGTP